jgi:histidyl-tRNA synthetase
MFRYERPQKGRYRQFHQIGVEAVGDVPPELEAEIIAMLFSFLQELGFTKLGLQINSIGDEQCLPAYLEALRAFVKSRWSELDEECHQRFERNVLRCLDCKNAGCKAVYRDAPKMADALCADCRDHHGRFKSSLGDFGIAFSENPNLVRGLDYYRRTAFEVTAAGLGAQDALLGGGRYDDLIKELGGPALPGFGFGIGLDRLVLAMEHADWAPSSPSPVCALLFDPDDAAKTAAYSLAEQLRNAEIPVYLSPKPGPFGLQFKWAGKLFADGELLKARSQTPFALVLGSKEIAAGIVTVKNMSSGAQVEIKLDELIETLKKTL